MPLPMMMISVSVGAIATMFFSATSANIINHSTAGKMPAPQSLCWWNRHLGCCPSEAGKMPAPQSLCWWNRHLGCCPSEAGKMPAPQAISLLVEQASCLSLKIWHQA
jgi:hypothetical protein